jgi:hypothetical protein
MSKKEHLFNDIDFFNRMKIGHLSKVKAELNHIEQWMNNCFDVEINIQKEVSLSTISFLLRRCSELEYIDLGDLKNKLNSILHAHKVFHMKDGSVVFQSDDDIKFDRPPFMVNKKFVDDLLVKIENWKK